MLTDNDMQELLEYRAQHPVLSVYLDTSPLEGNADDIKLRLRGMLKDVDLPGDVESVLRFFDHEHDWTGNSVVVFSCEPEDFFRSYTLAVPVRSRVRVQNRPYVKPLADLLDSYGGYGVALVDKEGARLYYFHLGEMREQMEVVGDEVRHTKRGGGSQALGRRGGAAGQTDYVEELAERNLRSAAEAATRFFTDHQVRRVLIGGTEDNVSLFRSLLPKAWQSLVVGSFPISMTAAPNEILDRTLEIGRKAEQKREKRLVEALVTGAAKGKGGVLGLDDTLKALHEGRVQTLVIKDGYRASGCRCQSCGNLSGVHLEECPYCGGRCEDIEDAVELAVRRVMSAGGDVEVLHDTEGVKGFQHIGAVLRY